MAKKTKAAGQPSQHAWLFPPSKEIQTPYGSGKDVRKAMANHNAYPKDLRFPPRSYPWIMEMIATFLADYKFHDTYTAFQKERLLRSSDRAWQAAAYAKIPDGFPCLVESINATVTQYSRIKICRDKATDDYIPGSRFSASDTDRRGGSVLPSDAISLSSPAEDNESEAREEEVKEAKDHGEDGDDEDEESAEEEESAPAARKSKLRRMSKVTNGMAESESSESSDSESEAVVNGQVASSSASSEGETSSESEREESPTANRKAAMNKLSGKHQVSGKVNGVARDASSSSSAESSSSDSGSMSASESDSASPPPPPPKRETPRPSKKRKQPDSLPTNSTNGHKKARHSSEASHQASHQAHSNSKSQNKRFQRVPADIRVEKKFQSNAYQPYDYAERAHRDLAPTKGKQFTKEKNKKKRGSYRGGVIDVHGKKGIKFD